MAEGELEVKKRDIVRKGKKKALVKAERRERVNCALGILVMMKR